MQAARAEGSRPHIILNDMERIPFPTTSCCSSLAQRRLINSQHGIKLLIYSLFLSSPCVGGWELSLQNLRFSSLPLCTRSVSKSPLFLGASFITLHLKQIFDSQLREANPLPFQTLNSETPVALDCDFQKQQGRKKKPNHLKRKPKVP